MDIPGIDLSAAHWASLGTVLLITLLLFLFAGFIFRRTVYLQKQGERINAARAFCVITLVLTLLAIFLTGREYEGAETFRRIALSAFTLLCTLFVFQVVAFFARKRFGSRKEVDDDIVFVETYSSRLVSMGLIVLLAMVALYTLIKIWGADSLLETTGIFGLIFAFLAFTSAQWAPDLISGLVILNAQSLEDGDIICIDGYKDEYIISKISFIYTMLFDVRNNNRTLIRNSRILQGKVDNLSRIASTEGIRRSICYKIGYPTTTGSNSKERGAALDEFFASVDDMFEDAFTICCEDEEIKINSNKRFEWALTATGDHALEYTLWYYLERFQATKVTATVRRHLIGTGYKVNTTVFRCAVANGIDLSTPSLLSVNFGNAAAEQTIETVSTASSN